MLFSMFYFTFKSHFFFYLFDLVLILQETDFEEGLKLIKLIEVLSGKRIGRYSKRVTFRSQKLENVSLALKFLEEEEKIKIVNVGQIILFFI